MESDAQKQVQPIMKEDMQVSHFLQLLKKQGLVDEECQANPNCERASSPFWIAESQAVVARQPLVN